MTPRPRYADLRAALDAGLDDHAIGARFGGNWRDAKRWRLHYRLLRPTSNSVGAGVPRSRAYMPNASTADGKQRKCLGCERMFGSTGPGNRICRACAPGINDAAPMCDGGWLRMPG